MSVSPSSIELMRRIDELTSKFNDVMRRNCDENPNLIVPSKMGDGDQEEREISWAMESLGAVGGSDTPSDPLSRTINSAEKLENGLKKANEYLMNQVIHQMKRVRFSENVDITEMDFEYMYTYFEGFKNCEYDLKLSEVLFEDLEGKEDPAFVFSVNERAFKGGAVDLQSEMFIYICRNTGFRCVFVK